jgi:hypothetical protein
MMKTLGLLLAGVALLAIAAPSAMARPDYKKAFDAKYAADENAPLAPVVAELKCNVCHYGKTKKNRNDYGTALSKLVTEKTYAELKSDKEQLTEVVTKALTKIEGEKSVSDVKFGELLKAGKAPGTAPEEDAAE